jgi:hypothetical protein
LKKGQALAFRYSGTARQSIDTQEYLQGPIFLDWAYLSAFGERPKVALEKRTRQSPFPYLWLNGEKEREREREMRPQDS